MAIRICFAQNQSILERSCRTLCQDVPFQNLSADLHQFGYGQRGEQGERILILYYYQGNSTDRKFRLYIYHKNLLQAELECLRAL